MPADIVKKPRIPTAALFLLAVFLFASSSFAQLTKTARIELDNNTSSLYFGGDIYINPDAEGRLTEQIVANRHENNLRGTRQESDVINLGLAPVPVWLVFSVTNNSSREDWVLHFGSLPEGRMGLVRKLIVKNQTRDETFVRAMRESGTEGAFGETINGAAIPIKITSGKTELLLVYLESEGSFPATFVPSLMTMQEHFKAFRIADIFSNLLMMFLIAAAAFFAAAAYVEKTPLFGLFSAYYIGNMAMFLLMNSMFFVPFSFGGDIPALLFPICFLVGLAMTWVFLDVTVEDYGDNALILSLGSFTIVSALIALVLPGNSSVFDELLIFIPSTLGMLAAAALAFNHAQKKGKLAGYFLAGGWLTTLAGILIAILAALQIFGGNAFFLNAYWLALVPQSILFIAGISKKIEAKRLEERAAMGRESRAAQSLARLKQSKETADQARLLRVIERERELMAELREQEMQRTEEMRRAKEMADQANRAKSAFLAVVSHEIRTPMTGIMGILRLLKDTKMSKDQGEYLLTIQKSSDTMMALLNDILDFEKIESGSMELEEIDFDLPKLVQGVLTLMSGHASGKNVTLKSQIPDDFPAVLKGDPTRLRQVLLNLVNNAIKFTENGTVTIHLRATRVETTQVGIGDYEVYFGVEDTGIGISEAAQAKLFNPFEQADASVSRKYGGTGLGLAICQRLITAMGGAIRVTSELGVGSTFFFSILLKHGSGEGVEDEKQAPAQSVQSGPPMRILVVEDNEINRKVLQNFLGKEGHSVALADSAERGLELFTRERFDVVFMDINLSGMNGLDAASMIRHLPDRRAAATPLIALTGNVAEEDVQAFYKAGFNEFMAKPIDYDRLLGLLGEIRKGVMKPQEAQKPQETQKSQEAQPQRQRQEERAEEAYVSREDDRAWEKTRGGGQDDVAPIHKFLQEQEQQNGKAPEPAAQAFVMEEDVFDVKMLEGLLRSLGKDQMKELLDGFNQKTDEIVAALGEAAKTGDAQAMYERAHELKGMAANFGMKELSKIAAVIEKAAHNNKAEHAMPEIEKLPAAAEKTKVAIKTWLG